MVFGGGARKRIGDNFALIESAHGDLTDAERGRLRPLRRSVTGAHVPATPDAPAGTVRTSR